MAYERFRPGTFFFQVSSEDEAREMFWRARFEGRPFECPRCCHEHYYEFATRPEVRRCRQCGKEVRVRAGTALAFSKKPLLVWARAIFLMMQDKRGVAASHVQRELSLKSYGTAWLMLHKIRHALQQREEKYQLDGVIELDGASFAPQATARKGKPVKDPPKRTDVTNEVLLAVQSKSWVDERGRRKERAGFAKVVVARETSIFAQDFVARAIVGGASVHTDGANAFKGLSGVVLEQQVMHALPARLDRWLPWVHRYIANAKSWLIGTHHGVGAKYLAPYLAEYTYRFNRRHDPNGLFHRALTACAIATPMKFCVASR